MVERQILFSAPLVRAILERRKTQTRRLVRPQGDHIKWWEFNAATGRWDGHDGLGKLGDLRCPYGVPGDRLWVREAWYSPPYRGSDTCIGYVADGDFPNVEPYRVRPSIHMPREASRITLDVTEVRVQRLQDTKESEARAEGIILREHPTEFSARGVVAVDGKAYMSVGSAWAAIWNSIYAKRAPWDSNPWIWAVSFRRLEESEAKP